MNIKQINWSIVVAVVVIVLVVTWAMSTILPRSYSGENLTFGVGNGIVTVNNPSDTPLAVQLVGTGSRAFTVGSTIEGIGGSSERQGSGNTSTQLYEYTLPPGVSDFTVTRGTSVNFISNTATPLEATVEPASEGEARSTLVVSALVVLGALYYMSRSTGHRWLKSLRPQPAPAPAVIASPVAEAAVVDPNRGRDGRMYSNYGKDD
jgi:hypothetical protein